jgi:transposase InsO family protein
VWSWDITWLPGPARGLFFYLYLIIDLYSRKIVGWEVHERECAEYAAGVVRRAVLAEGCVDKPLVLHADNGSPQKGSALRTTLEALGVLPSYSRPRVSDDNAFSEAVFRTCKYRPHYPYGGFESLEAARCLGVPVRALVSPRAPPQRHPLRDSAAAPSTRRQKLGAQNAGAALPATGSRWARCGSTLRRVLLSA